jgi:multiple antibiotic resistance protein
VRIRSPSAVGGAIILAAAWPPELRSPVTLISAALLLFLVMDPLGNVPFFLTELKRVRPERRRLVLVRELLIALAVLVLFLFTGGVMLDLLRISSTALTVAGGVILLLIALRMIFPTRDSSLQEELPGEPFIVPLAIPYLAGPSALATELLITNQDPSRWPEWLGAVLLAWFATAIIVYFATDLGRLLGERVLIAVERLMGMVLVAVAIQMLLTGLDLYFSR